jgi:hypothetical protein
MPEPKIVVERVQTGVRLEKRILKVLKALAELHDMTLGDLLEGVLLHAFEGKGAFQPATLRQIAQLKRIYGLDLGAGASHRLRDAVDPASKAPAKPARASRRPRGGRAP